jgi:hypothetical protein
LKVLVAPGALDGAALRDPYLASGVGAEVEESRPSNSYLIEL